MSIQEEDLGLILAPWHREYEDITTGELLDEEDQVYEIHVHGRDVAALRDPGVEASYDFDAVIEFDEEMSAEEFVDVEYRTWIHVFEDEFSEAELYYPDPDIHL